MDKMAMPREEWESFKADTLDKYSLSDMDIRHYRMVFLGALSTATDFFTDLMTGDGSPEEKKKVFEEWMEGLQVEINDLAVEALTGSRGGGFNGRNN